MAERRGWIRAAAAGAVILGMAAAPVCATGEDAAEMKPKAANTPFEKMKALAGEWKGTASHGDQKGIPTTVLYKVTGAGSAVMETLFPGTPHEMVSVYFNDGSDLVMTHYCAMGNQPRMKLKRASDPGQMAFAFDGGTNVKGAHMDSLELTFVDADHLKANWHAVDDAGKPAESASFDVTRKN